MPKFVHFVLSILVLTAFSFIASPTHVSATAPFSFPKDSPPTRLERESCSTLASDTFFPDLIGWVIDPFLTLGDFARLVKTGDPKTITGVYVCHVLALKIAQQPPNDPVFVSTELETATQFRLAANYGTLGLLAHNDRAGAKFFGLQTGQEVDIVYGDGSVRRYIVSNIRHFKPTNSDDPYSNFVDVDNGGYLLTSTQVFRQIFASGDQVVFQTCISANGNPIWGRLFVIATPMWVN